MKTIELLGIERYFPQGINKALASRLLSGADNDVPLVVSASQVYRESRLIENTAKTLYSIGNISSLLKEVLIRSSWSYRTLGETSLDTEELMGTGRMVGKRQYEIEEGESLSDDEEPLGYALLSGLEAYKPDDVSEEDYNAWLQIRMVDRAEEYLMHMRDLQYLQQDPTGFLLVDKILEEEQKRRELKRNEFSMEQLMELEDPNMVNFMASLQKDEDLYNNLLWAQPESKYTQLFTLINLDSDVFSSMKAAERYKQLYKFITSIK